MLIEVSIGFPSLFFLVSSIHGVLELVLPLSLLRLLLLYQQGEGGCSLFLNPAPNISFCGIIWDDIKLCGFVYKKCVVIQIRCTKDSGRDLHRMLFSPALEHNGWQKVPDFVFIMWSQMRCRRRGCNGLQVVEGKEQISGRDGGEWDDGI